MSEDTQLMLKATAGDPEALAHLGLDSADQIYVIGGAEPLAYVYVVQPSGTLERYGVDVPAQAKREIDRLLSDPVRLRPEDYALRSCCPLLERSAKGLERNVPAERLLGLHPSHPGLYGPVVLAPLDPQPLTRADFLFGLVLDRNPFIQEELGVSPSWQPEPDAA